MTKKELEAQFQELRHIILNGILDMKYLIKKKRIDELSLKCEGMEKAIEKLGSDTKEKEDDI